MSGAFMPRVLIAFALAVSAPALASDNPAAAPPLYKAGTEFKDCAECPVMVVLPQQSFVMGSPSGETGRSPNEAQRKVTIKYPIAVAKFEVTFEQWEACLTD